MRWEPPALWPLRLLEPRTIRIDKELAAGLHRVAANLKHTVRNERGSWQPQVYP